MGSNIQKKYLTGNSYDPMVYKNDEFSWQEGDYTVYRSTQWTGPGCHDGCGVLFYVKDGKVAKVEGDPTNQWSNGALCMRCLDGQEAFNAPNRLQKPAKRDRNERGKNTWVDISWEEAYDILEEQVRSIQEEYGSRSIVSCIGTGRNTIWQYPAMHYASFPKPQFLWWLPFWGFLLFSAKLHMHGYLF